MNRKYSTDWIHIITNFIVLKLKDSRHQNTPLTFHLQHPPGPKVCHHGNLDDIQVGLLFAGFDFAVHQCWYISDPDKGGGACFHY